MMRAVWLCRNMVEVKPSASGRDDEAARRLWEISCELLQLPVDWAAN